MADNVTLGNYRVLRLIGEGGFSRVHLGEHLFLKTYAAIKVPKAQLDTNDLEAFLSEARRGVGLRHPHILRTLECGIEGGTTPYIIMEYAPGGSVRSRYPSGTPLPPAAVITYIKQAGSALQYIHDQGLIHQDIKPGNMLLDSNDQLLLSDFGIAIVAHRTVTQSMQDISGTARYMAPEQFTGRVRPASDQYALAVVVYEWICGSGPFDGSLAELYYLHAQAAPPALHLKAPNISPAVEQVVLRALAKDPRDRFACVQDFVNALEQAGQPSSSPRIATAISSPNRTLPDVEEDTPTVQTRPPVGAPFIAPMRTAQAVPPPTYVPEYQANEEAIPTIISDHRIPAVSPNPYTPPVSPVTPTPSFLPSYSPYPPRAVEVGPPPLAPTRAPSRGPSLRLIIILASLAFIVVAGSVAFFLVSLNHPAAQTQGRPTVPVTHTPPPPYSPMFGFNTQHTRYNPAETTLSASNVGQLKKFWSASLSSPVYSSPVIAGGVVYITSTDNHLFAFNATTGQKLWDAFTGNYNPVGSFINSSPAIVNGVLYIGSSDDRVYAFDAINGGRPLWVSSTGGPIYSSPAVVNGIVYIGSSDHNVYAFEATSGSLRWMTPTGAGVYSSPAVVNGVVYIGSNDHKLYALDAGTGKTLWTGLTQWNINSSPAVVDGVVYTGSDDRSFYAFAADGCNQAACPPLWMVKTGDYIFSSPAIAGGIAFIGSNDHKLYAYDTTQCANITCSPLWTATTRAGIISSPTVANGVVYISSTDGKIYAFDVHSGTQLWNFSTGSAINSSPTVFNGVMYVGSNDHNLYAFRL